MAGVGYTFGAGRLLTTVSIVAGPSFNAIEADEQFEDEVLASGLTLALDAENSFAVRPGVNLTYTVAPRVAIVGFGGYLINRPDIVFRASNVVVRDDWKADAFVLSVGAVYSIF
jgi:hypothetical protein